MNMITTKKIIAMLIVAVMIMALTTPIFAKSNSNQTSTRGALFGGLLKMGRNLIEILCKLFFSPKPEPEPPPTKVKFGDVAKDCMTILREKHFTYDKDTSYTFTSKTPEDMNKGKINCSGYVSWVIYEYANKNKYTQLKSDFKTSKSSQRIYNYMKENSNDFKYIGKLNEVKIDKLERGDILVRPGNHIEIFAKYDDNKNNHYRCYNAGSNECIRDNADGKVDGITGGGCNGAKSKYYVYRIK